MNEQRHPFKNKDVYVGFTPANLVFHIKQGRFHVGGTMYNELLANLAFLIDVESEFPNLKFYLDKLEEEVRQVFIHFLDKDNEE
jgi:hypothetical protein